MNVVRGEMSLVGPRPLLMQYLERYSGDQSRRHEVRPGLTGLAQVAGRNCVPWNEKFRLDVYYVDHQSVVLDLAILARTLKLIIARVGISEASHATMTEFRGNHGQNTTLNESLADVQ